MTVLPITPTEIDPSELLDILQLQDTNLSSSHEGNLGLGVLRVMVQPDKKLLVLSFNGQQKMILTSNSKAWLNHDNIMIPHIQGGLWKVHCSNQDQLSELQDLLTFYIKYENRHHMKNTLALMDPISCQVTQVIADNVTIDLEQEDPIESKEKVPVYVDSKEKVKFLYRSGDAMMTGSDWIANALVFTGQTLAQGISSGSQLLEKKIVPNPTLFKLSDQDKTILDTVYNTTHTVTNAAGQMLNKIIMTGTNRVPKTETTAPTHFGWSTLRATATLLGGVATATNVILESSRQGLTQVIRKKYGSDAGYLAEKTMGTASHLAGLLVYFDAKGISRTVIVSSLTDKREVLFENKEKDQIQ